MKTVKCLKCHDVKKVADNVAMAICTGCQRIMVSLAEIEKNEGRKDVSR
jgi:hypothetical protein